MKAFSLKNIPRIHLHIAFWMCVWIFKGVFQYSVNKHSYVDLPFSQQLLLNFGLEFVLTLIKAGLSYTIAQLYFKNKKHIGTIDIILIALVFFFGMFLRVATLFLYLGYFEPLSPYYSPEIFTDITRLMNSIIDNGFFIGVFLIIKNYKFKVEGLKREQKLEMEKLRYEKDFLRAQINPHFLFNTMNNLFSQAQEKGNDDLADSISKLSVMMRYMIYDSNTERVLLKKEIDYLEGYIGLNKLRYQNEELSVDFKYPKNLNGELIAPMLLIPFVENAFKHGVSINKKSSIELSIKESDNELYFTCLNNNYGTVHKMESTGIGLQNVKRRLNLLYPEKHSLCIASNEFLYSVELKINLS